MDDLIQDLLLNSNLSQQEIADELGITKPELKKHVKRLGLDWVRRKERKMSRGHAALYHMLKKMVPNETVVTEHHVGERLFLDIYCPALKLAIEFHGRQHFEYNEHFHGSLEEFQASQRRDERKEELCERQGIALIAFRYNDDLSEDVVFQRILEGIRSSEPVKEEPKTKARYKGNPYYEAAKQRQREYRREQYRKMKKRQ